MNAALHQAVHERSVITSGKIRKPFHLTAVCVIAFISSAARLNAQARPAPQRTCSARQLPSDVLNSSFDQFARVAQLAGVVPLNPFVIRRPSDPQAVLTCAANTFVPWSSAMRSRDSTEFAAFELLPFTAHTFFNSAYPVDRNNGAVWAGRGLSVAGSAGLRASLGPLSIGVQPTLLYEQNTSFEAFRFNAARFSAFAYPWHLGVIDWPERFGEAEIRGIDPGQSYARANILGLSAGVSTENLWWGPALRNPLLMSNTAPGFPHVFLGTYRPLATPIGRFEAQIVTGRLAESKFFDFNPSNDRRLFSGIIVDYQPRGLPGLSVGAARSYLSIIPPEGLTLSGYFIDPFLHPSQNPSSETAGDNQLLSAFGRWALPSAGFEAYAEWAREDHWEDLADLLKEPDHSQAYTFGFNKVIVNRRSWLRLYGELTHLEAALPFRGGRGIVTFYTHSQIIQGYTHQGQLLGASLGPGSDGQILGADIYTASGLVGIYLERVRHDDDAYYNIWAPYYGFHGHDVEVSAALRNAIVYKSVEVASEFAYSHRFNPRFVGLDGQNWTFRSERNLYGSVKLSWRPAVRLSARRAKR